MNELAPPSGEGYAWSQSRASSGSWDEAPGSQKKEEHSALYARQRQATAAQAAALSGSGGQFMQLALLECFIYSHRNL